MGSASLAPRRSVAVHPRIRRLALPAGGFLDVLWGRYAGFAFSPHAHAECAIGVALEGRHRLVVGGQDITVRAGDVVVLPPETIHAVDSFGAEPWSYLMLYVPIDIVRAALGSGCDRVRPVGGDHVITDAEVARVIQELATALLDGESSACAPTELCLLHSLTRQCVEPATTAPCAGAVDATVVELLRALVDPSVRTPSVSALAEARGLSVFQLIRRFRTTVGSTPIEYRTHIRARWARMLLGEARSIGEVAHLAGYADQSHLNRHFKRVFGMTPGAYRNAMRPATLQRRGAPPKSTS